MWLLGVGLIAQFTATVTSSQTARQLRADIQGPGDLPGKTIATVPGSSAAAYLTRLGLPFTPIADADAGYALLVGGQIQAIVYEAPTLQYWAARRGRGVLQVVGPVFLPQKFGMAVAPGSSLRKQIDGLSSRCTPTEATKTSRESGSLPESRGVRFAERGNCVLACALALGARVLVVRGEDLPEPAKTPGQIALAPGPAPAAADEKESDRWLLSWEGWEATRWRRGRART